MTMLQKLSLWIWPSDKRAQMVRSLCKKNKQLRKEYVEMRERAIAAERALTDGVFDMRQRIKSHDRKFNTTLDWRL